ncbi:MAG: hypothetical protein JWO41_608 [Candidatus Saccharibacteria bacterium]|nr:hypothetical protein [Candidatus Saccharibacteria bacterium]
MPRTQVNLELIQSSGASKQARAIQGILKSQRVKDMLGAERPNILKRFQNPRESTETLRSFAETPGLLAFIIRLNRMPTGVGLAAENQSITHPTEGTISGDWLGYWVAPGLNIDVHQELAEQLLNVRAEAKCQLATALPGHKSGFRWLMTAVGEPSFLLTDAQGVGLGVVNYLEREQLYVSGKSVDISAQVRENIP